MSVIATLRRLTGRDRISIPSSSAIERAAGVRSASDAEYRIQRIGEHLAQTSERSSARVREIVEFLDQWVILETNRGWIPFPGWDDEPLLREASSTREEAEAAVAHVGGSLRPGRLQSLV